MTEIAAGGTLNYPRIYKQGSVGIPLLKIVISAFDPESGKELSYNEKGEICIQTPATMLGYVNNTKETDNIIRLHDDGKMWVHSGDLGYVTEDGFIFIIGRLKRYYLYIMNGIQKKIFSIDIEKNLLEHPKVDNCAVVAIPDDITFQKPVAYIILKRECSPGETTENELKVYCERKLLDGCRPVRFIFLEKFPLTKIGKVDYIALEKMAES